MVIAQPDTVLLSLVKTFRVGVESGLVNVTPDCHCLVVAVSQRLLIFVIGVNQEQRGLMRVSAQPGRVSSDQTPAPSLMRVTESWSIGSSDATIPIAVQ